MSIKPPPPLNGPYELFILALSTFAVLSLAVEAFVGLDPDTVAILRYADLVICALFFLDFLYPLRRAPDRGRYLVTWGWLDLLSSIPGIAALRLGRAGRIVRIVRVLRGLRSTRQLVTSFVRLRAASTFFAAGLVALVVLIFSSAAILQFETGPTANIRGPEDAIWWAFSTITTVGYGDRYPVTTEGRLIGMLLMTVGVGLFATFSGFVASWFLAPQEAEEESEIRKLREEVGEVRPAGEGGRGVRWRAVLTARASPREAVSWGESLGAWGG
ncbi:MAG: ion transporter [Gemmatimonadota bacterium]|nr:ion transporter [Gemmatimonadota bacterium]